jgi:LPS-assembly protein
MPKATVLQPLRRYVLLSLLLPVVLANPSPTRAQNPATAPQQSQQIKPPKPVAKTPSATPGEQATLEAKQQRQVGQIFYADGDVDVRYENTRLRADHVEYNEDTQVVVARGRVQLDYLTQHLEATDARYELSTGRGTFHNVRATFAVQRRPPAPPREVNAMQRQPAQTLLISPNPIYFEAEEAERVDENTYIVHHSWMTVCDPDKPTWKFYAPKATVYIKTSIHLENGSFRVFSVPILYVPYATFPAEKQRASGFLLPDSGESSSKGFIFGDAVYWAPTDWADFTLGANYYSRRGWAQKAALRVRPWENAVLDVTYSEVEDRGLPQPTGPPINQGGLEVRLLYCPAAQ